MPCAWRRALIGVDDVGEGVEWRCRVTALDSYGIHGIPVATHAVRMVIQLAYYSVRPDGMRQQ